MGSAIFLWQSCQLYLVRVTGGVCMRPYTQTPARHARLFELIRQDNLAARACRLHRPAKLPEVEQLAIARRAGSTLKPRKAR